MVDFDKKIKKSFNGKFCNFLEYHLTRAFKNSPSANKFEHIWCDGVEEPEVRDLWIEDFMETREVITRAWLGFGGEHVYKMTIKLGDKSWEKCTKGLSLIRCLPSDQSVDWVKLDTQNRSIILQLK